MSAPFWLLIAFLAGRPETTWTVEPFWGPTARYWCIETAYRHNVSARDGVVEYCTPSMTNPFDKSPV